MNFMIKSAMLVFKESNWVISCIAGGNKSSGRACEGEHSDRNQKWIHDAGRSWFELMVNFYVSTARHFPVRQSESDEPSRNAGSSVFLDYNSTEAKMLPHSMRSAAKQTVACQSAIQSLQGLGEDKWIPSHVRAGGTSMKHLGFKQNLKGLQPRPILLFQRETLQQLKIYFAHLQGATNLFAPMDIFSFACAAEDFPVDEPTAGDRYCRYLRIKNYGIR